MADDDLYPHFEDAEWLALDRDGLIARFTTGGAGPVPRLARVHQAAHLALSELIAKAKHAGEAELAVKCVDPSDFERCAEQGVFAYDWGDVHRTFAESINAYECIALPTKPLAFASLQGVAEGTEAILPRFSFSCAERSRIATDFEIEWLRPVQPAPPCDGPPLTWNQLNTEQINRQIGATMERLRLNRGDEARYDEAGKQELLNALHYASHLGDRHTVARATMFLGRLLQLRRRHGEARLLYLKSKTLFAEQESAHWVPAKEYLNECPEGNAAAQKLYEERRDAVAAGTMSAETLAEEFFREFETASAAGKQPSLWQRLFG